MLSFKNLSTASDEGKGRTMSAALVAAVVAAAAAAGGEREGR